MTEKKDLRSPTVCIENLPSRLSDGTFQRFLASMQIEFLQSYIAQGVDGGAKGYAFLVVSDWQYAERCARRIDGAKLGDRTLVAVAGQERPQRQERVA